MTKYLYISRMATGGFSQHKLVGLGSEHWVSNIGTTGLTRGGTAAPPRCNI